eukprot:UN27990
MLEINLSFNNLTNVRWASTLTNLERITISHNSLDNINTLLINCPKLKFIKAGNNKIRNITDDIKCTKLEELWLNGNKLNIIDLEKIVRLNSLQRLVLKPNPCCEHKHYKEK